MHDGLVKLLKLLPRITSKINFLAGIIKRSFGQLLARYLIYLARENRYWAQLTLRPISALHCQINQISDSSRPNNCILFSSAKNRDNDSVISLGLTNFRYNELFF